MPPSLECTSSASSRPITKLQKYHFLWVWWSLFSPLFLDTPAVSPLLSQLLVSAARLRRSCHPRRDFSAELTVVLEGVKAQLVGLGVPITSE